MRTQKSDMSVVTQVPAIKPAVADKGKIKIGGAAISLIKPVKK
jgi:hypothetical protein